MRLSILDGTYAICRLEPKAALPSWIDPSCFWTVTRSEDELSVVCSQAGVPGAVKAERDWRILKVAGPLDFGLTGVLSSIAKPLAEAKISIFAVSTFDTDYVMVRAEKLAEARHALAQAGFVI